MNLLFLFLSGNSGCTKLQFSFEVPDPRTSAAAKSNYGALLAPAIKEIEILDSQVVFWNNHMIAH